MSDNEYTPTTTQVKMDFAYLGGRSDEEQYDGREAAFDRWLADHDARIKSEAADKALRDAAKWLRVCGQDEQAKWTDRWADDWPDRADREAKEAGL